MQATGEPGQAVTFAVSGHIALATLPPLKSRLTSLLNHYQPAALTVDLAGVTYLDSAGALLLVELEEEARARGITFTLAHASEEVQKILGIIDRQALTAPPLKVEEKAGVVEKVGAATLKFVDDLVEVTVFVGDLCLALMYSVLHPRQVRWGEVGFYMRRAGVGALPILGLLSFLLGMVMAFMSSLQLEQFGATLYVSSLVGIAMVQELGPLLTAILVAGRSGSAFAAEIGTMMVNEEVDAITVMGFDPIKFLAVPKVLASMLVVPLLAVYATFFGILGGLLIGVSLLDITMYSYILETRKAIALFDIISSLVKSAVFAVIIAGLGCQRGFRVRGGAEAVGAQTTAAVVAGIFLIIVVDSLFAVALHYIR
ncbi:MAG: MlaE family lipid ABC transporter permease subunit [Deltaproteobacteria bacterium]|nr:MlaE family lipid ABC transporter permease subunit [Deltaproteobacteria bacterium]